jgi:hypothetical protein
MSWSRTTTTITPVPAGPPRSRSLGYRVVTRLRQSEGLPLCLPCLAADLQVSEQEVSAAARIPDLLGFERSVWWCYTCGRKRDVIIATAPSPSRRPAA